MLLLIFYVFVALGFSFLCSVAEAVILSVSPAYISLLEQKGKRSGKLLRQQSNDINKPLSAILTLNTIAHTMGAAGAGAQAAVVFGDAYLGLASAVLTLLILVFSEIIPKTLGATYWRQLAPVTAYFLQYLMKAMYPFVAMSAWLTRGFSEETPLRGLNRGELMAMAQLSKEEGQIAAMEANIMENMFKLHELKVKDAMTHRTVVESVAEDLTIEEFFAQNSEISFSRIPIFEEDDTEKVTGFVLKSDLLVAHARGELTRKLSEFRKDMITLLSDMPLAQSYEHFIHKRTHMLLVVDEYGGLEGILSLEDLLESLLGIDIVDEQDKTVSMKRLAKLMWKRRERNLLSKES